MKNPFSILLILVGIGGLLVIAELLLTSASARTAFIPVGIAICVSLGALGSGIVLIIADIKYKLPPDEKGDRYRDRY
jgi:hypothetical protein